MEHIRFRNIDIPVHVNQTLIVGTGAAGLSVAVTLLEWGYRDFYVLNPMIKFIGGGASYCSGSDKQTIYKQGNFGSIADSPYQFAQTLYQGGCMNGYQALIEGNYSLRAFYRLAHLGVPFPHTKNGGYVGYKTDHDPFARADSVGPRTSQTMVKKLAAFVEKNHPDSIMSGHELVDLVVEEGVIKGVITFNVRQSDSPSMGLSAFLAENVVIATGGPGQIYRDSVLPRDMYGTHGLCFRRGVKGANLAEMQFGIGTGSGSNNFPWNLSGTYMQVIPNVYSTDSVDGSGPRRQFLADWFPDTASMALAVFLKGYQWPFHAEKLSNHGSSLFDLAVREEIQQGRSVWLDFTRDLEPGEGMEPFSLEGMPEEARDYLLRNGATHPTPIQRLRHMNALAIELYESQNIYIESRGEPLRFAVNYQHQNGGMFIDENGMSNIRNLYFNGEAAAAHGVTRPGGAALNMGQTLGIHIAEHLIALRNEGRSHPVKYDEHAKSLLANTVDEVWARVEGFRRGEAEALTTKGATCPTSREVIQEIRERMMRSASFVVTPEGVSQALKEAREQYRRIQASGLRPAEGHPGKQFRMCFVADDMLLNQLAILTTLDHYLRHGGGSRGSRAVLDPQGQGVVHRKGVAQPHLTYRKNDPRHTEEILVVEMVDGSSEFRISQLERAPLPTPEAVNDAVFEVEWRKHRERMEPRQEKAPA